MVLWDPTGLSKEKLVLPLNYFFIIQHFDGEHSLAEIGALYLKRFGEFLVPSKMDQLVSDLNEKLFLEGQRAEDARTAGAGGLSAEPAASRSVCRAGLRSRRRETEKTDRRILYVERRTGLQTVRACGKKDQRPRRTDLRPETSRADLCLGL